MRFLILLLGLSFGLSSCALAAEVDLDRLVDAVYLAEGGEKASVPYGLVNSKWCMQEKGWCRYYAKEILRIHRLRCSGDDNWLGCIASYYAPRNVANDPDNLNQHWEKNVRYYYDNS